MKMLYILTALFLLSACDENCKWEFNQELRHKYFVECISIMKVQPRENHEDDNGHVVKACDDAAYSQAKSWICKRGQS